MFDKLLAMLDGTKTGVFERIELTWGSRGQQLVTIDGEKYATWLNYQDFPKRGQIIKHEPFRQYGMHCTTILEIDGLPFISKVK